MYGIYSQLVFRPFTPKRFGKTRLIFINCLKACNCCTLMDIIACFTLPKTSLLFQKSSNYLYYSNPYFPRINRNIRACSQDNSNKKIKWEKLYDFKTVYNVPDLSPNSLLQIYNTIWTKDDLGWLIYLKLYKFNTLNKINGMYHGSLFDLTCKI